jgi:two-component system nitrate/nitrite response regulator NarL
MSEISGKQVSTLSPGEQSRPSREQIRVLIVHPNRLFREALAVAVASQRRSMKVVGCLAELDHVRHAQPVQGALAPDVILVNSRPTTPETLREAVRLRSLFGTAKVLILGRHPTGMNLHFLKMAVEAANRVVHVAGSLKELLWSIQVIGRGQRIPPRVFDSTIRLSVSAEQPAHESNSEQMGLTRREREILTLRQRGFINKEIAVALHIEPQTVKNHVHSLLIKLQLKGQRTSFLSAPNRPILQPIKMTVNERSSLACLLCGSGRRKC